MRIYTAAMIAALGVVLIFAGSATIYQAIPGSRFCWGSGRQTICIEVNAYQDPHPNPERYRPHEGPTAPGYVY
jgi:hypothetical protein